MSLLTKAERQAMNREQRRALRKERRAERKAERQADGGWPKGLGLNLGKLRELATPLILDMAGDVVPGPEKMDEVLDELAEQADAFLVWTWAGPAAPLLELADGPALRALIGLAIRPHIQRLYDDLRALGVVQAEAVP